MFLALIKMCICELVRKIESWKSGDLKSGRGKPKIIWSARVLNDMKDLTLQVDMV